MQPFCTVPLWSLIELSWYSSTASETQTTTRRRCKSGFVVHQPIFVTSHDFISPDKTGAFFQKYFCFYQPQNEDEDEDEDEEPEVSTGLSPADTWSHWLNEGSSGVEPVQDKYLTNPEPICHLFSLCPRLINQRLPEFMVVCGRLIKRRLANNIFSPLDLCSANSGVAKNSSLSCWRFYLS